MGWLVAIVALGVVGACEPARLVVKPLPELVVAGEPEAIGGRELVLPVGEVMVWEVRWKGFVIGRAEVVVGEREVRSEFRTGRLVSALAAVVYELETVIDRGGARAERARELLDVDGEREEIEVRFEGARYAIGPGEAECGEDRRCGELPGGKLGHTLHSALGALRAWAPRAAGAGYLFVIHAGAVYRVEVEAPRRDVMAGQGALRIDGRIRGARGGEEQVTFVMWLSGEAAPRPLRVEVRTGEVEVTAEMIDAS